MRVKSLEPKLFRRYGWLGAFSVLAVLLLWWLSTAAGWIDSFLLPSPQQVVNALLQLAQRGYMGASLGQHLASSLGRIGLALLACVLSAVPLGIAMGRSAWLRALIDPLVEWYRPVPPLAYLPLIVIWLGIGELSKIVLIYLSMFAPLLIATVDGVCRVDRNRVLAVLCLGANRWQLVWRVLLPGALPQILTGLRVALGVGWSTLVAAELVAASRGLGFMVQSAAQFLATDVVIAGILLIALSALTCEWALRRLQRRFAAWT